MKAGLTADTLTLSEFNTAMAGRTPPLRVSAEFTAQNGNRFFGTNGAFEFAYLPKQSLVRQAIQSTPQIKVYHGYCAEMCSIARAEQAGVRINSGTITQLRHRIENGVPLGGSIGHNTWIKPCDDCRPVLNIFNIDYKRK